MISHTGTINVMSPSRAAPVRIEAGDPRSDDRRRVVEVTRDGVTIRRAVAGVAMAVRVDARAFRGVALRIAGFEDGRFRYELSLAHQDPDLSVPLGGGGDLVAVETQWRAWVAFLGLPALAGRGGATDAAVDLDATELPRRRPCARRRGHALRLRRPNFLRRRGCGAISAGRIGDVHAATARPGRTGDS